MEFEGIQYCRACGKEIADNTESFAFGTVPLAGNFCKTQESAFSAKRYPLALLCCDNCYTVQVSHDVNDKELFSEYNYASSTVSGLNRHFIGYAEYLVERYKSKERINFLEVGCNDGVLLKKLPDTWHKTGVDPSDIALKYKDDSYILYNRPFGKALVENEKVVEKYDVISGSNCLAHITDIKEVFEAAWMALKKEGDFFIEVHDLNATIKGNQWDTLYHEHKLEWDIDALKNVLHQIGFTFREVNYLPLHGGLIRARFSKSNQPGKGVIIEGREKLRMLRKLHDAYKSRYDSELIRLLQKQPGERIVAYGAAGRAVMFLNHLDELRFNEIIDDSPVRIGKFIPGVGTSIVGSEIFKNKEFDYCLVTAWNYFEDIKRNNPLHKGAWLKYFGNENQI